MSRPSTSSTSAERGRALEQQIATYFASHGYRVSTNQVLVGRTGSRHEIDVLAEKSDALTSFRVAVECKAWNTPIEKDVVSKLHYVMGDLGLHKGVIVSLAGARSGADTAAESLGIDMWGPDQLRRHLGESVFADVTQLRSLPTGRGSGQLISGWDFAVDPDLAYRTAAEAGKGRFGRTLEELTWFAPLWVPAYLFEMTVAQPGGGRRHSVTSKGLVNFYDALEGGYLGRPAIPPIEIPVGDATCLKPIKRDTHIPATLRKAVEARQKVSSQAAIQRHNATLAGLGIPTPVHSVSIDTTTLVHLPVYAGLLHRDQDRIVAIYGGNGKIHEPLSRLLTSQLAHIRSSYPG